MKFNKEKHKVLLLGRNNPMHQYMPWAFQLERIWTEKDLRVPVDIKLNMSQQHALAAKRRVVSRATLDKALPAGGGS